MTNLTDAELAAMKARADAATQMASRMRPGTTAHETIYGLGEDVPALLVALASERDKRGEAEATIERVREWTGLWPEWAVPGLRAILANADTSALARHDAEFIARARADVPALLAEVAALRKQIDLADKAPHEPNCDSHVIRYDLRRGTGRCTCWRAEYDAAKGIDHE